MLGSVNCYLIENDGRAVLVDTGMAAGGNLEVLETRLRAHGTCLDSLERVVCTHYHPDHCGQARHLQQRGIPVVVSSNDARALENYFADAGVDERRSFFYGDHEVPESFHKYVVPAFGFLRSLIEPFTADERCEDGDEIELAGEIFQVLVTPGHTDGHICLFHREKKILFTGDQVLNDTSVNISLRRESVHAVPLDAYLSSLHRIAALDVRIAYSGHGEKIQDLAVRCARLEKDQKTRLARVSDALTDAPLSAMALSERAFGRKRRPFSQWLSIAQTISCLEHLVSRRQAISVHEGNKIRFSGV